MSTHKTLEHAGERDRESSHGRASTALAAAIVAIVAAVGTLLANHRSVQALNAKSDATLLQSRATYSIVSVVDRQPSKTLDELVAAGRNLEAQADAAEELSDTLLNSYETIEVGTTIGEIAIVFISISALTRTRALFYGGIAAATVSVALILIGQLAH
jgi:hypothetical protein